VQISEVSLVNLHLVRYRPWGSCDVLDHNPTPSPASTVANTSSAGYAADALGRKKVCESSPLAHRRRQCADFMLHPLHRTSRYVHDVDGKELMLIIFATIMTLTVPTGQLSPDSSLVYLGVWRIILGIGECASFFPAQAYSFSFDVVWGLSIHGADCFDHVPAQHGLEPAQSDPFPKPFKTVPPPRCRCRCHCRCMLPGIRYMLA